MAKFQNKHLKLRDNQRAYFGDSDNASLYFDGSEFRSSTTISGVNPVQDYHLTTKFYVDAAIIGATGSGISYSDYVLTNGTRPFTGAIEGVTPTSGTHLTTKSYVDSAISSSVITSHSNLTGLGNDDHTQYVPTDGSRGFTATVSGVDPTVASDLATKNYVDSQTGSLHKSGREVISNNASSVAVTFAEAYADTNYSVSLIMSNTVDAQPSIYPMIVSAKATTGFTALFSGDIDSANYTLEWITKKD